MSGKVILCRNALSGTPPPAGRNMQVQTAEEVVAMIAALIDCRYFADVAAFESTVVLNAHGDHRTSCWPREQHR